MAKVGIVYWSGTGNTEKMADLIAKGATEAGAEVENKNVSWVKQADLAGYDVIAFGSPSMGAEVVEEAEMEPFVNEALPALKGKKVALFGSYGWGDGEWMRNWSQQMKDAGATLLDDGLTVHEAPEGDSEGACVEYGKKMAAF